MRFVLDENVPVSVGDLLSTRGHRAESILEYVLPGSSDPLVATAAQDLSAVLVTFDGDFKKIAPRVPRGHRQRFRRLSRIWFQCYEWDAAARLDSCLPFIEDEFRLAQRRSDGRMFITIGASFLRTDR